MNAHDVRLIDAARAVIAALCARVEVMPEAVLDALADAHDGLTRARAEIVRRGIE